ncbi:helix-turn-helix domain-containing protein [Streptomyces chartreusis]|uniref:helix-turn-helix domain-containing protein n=1 Tax=Streptomyces chartreusis TaxID=1969 RepID=UPI0036659AFC
MRFNRPIKGDLPEDRRKLAEALRAQAQESGLTADQIARRAHASKGAISQAMSGTRVPSESLFRSIVTAVGRDPLSPQWVALYLAAITAVAALIGALMSGAEHIGSEPEPQPPAYPYTPPVQIAPGAKLYKQPSGDTRFAPRLERSVAGAEITPDHVCVSGTGSRTTGSRRYGISGFSTGIEMYVAEEDLVIPSGAGIDVACSDYAQVKSGAKLYWQPIGDLHDPAVDRAFADVDFRLDHVCISRAPGPRRYGLRPETQWDFLPYAGEMYVVEGDLVVSPGADIGDCPPFVQLKPGAKLYKQPTGDTLIDKLGDAGQDVDAEQVCITESGSQVSATRRYGVTGLESGLVHYVADEDLLILPEAGSRRTCPDYAQITSGANVYAQPDGNMLATRPNTQFYSGADIDPDHVCISETEFHTSGERRYGLYDFSGASMDGLVYVDEWDVEMPSMDSLGVCAAW